jgi:hypothetical protein
MKLPMRHALPVSKDDARTSENILPRQKRRHLTNIQQAHVTKEIF